MRPQVMTNPEEYCSLSTLLGPACAFGPPQSAFHACTKAAFNMMYVIGHERIDFHLIFPRVPPICHAATLSTSRGTRSDQIPAFDAFD